MSASHLDVTRGDKSSGDLPGDAGHGSQSPSFEEHAKSGGGAADSAVPGLAGEASHHVTQLLISWSGGNQGALEALTPIVYDELRRLARHYMRQERGGHTLQSTAVVHEAYIRLVDQKVKWNGRAHFFAIAAQMMRRILVDHARAQLAAKRGSGTPVISLEQDVAGPGTDNVDILALNEALDRLSKMDPQRSRIVELRFFGGLTKEESAVILGISPATVQRQWMGAKAWLQHELRHRT